MTPQKLLVTDLPVVAAAFAAHVILAKELDSNYIAPNLAVAQSLLNSVYAAQGSLGNKINGLTASTSSLEAGIANMDKGISELEYMAETQHVAATKAKAAMLRDLANCEACDPNYTAVMEAATKLGLSK